MVRIKIRIQIDLLGFGVLRFAQQKGRKGAGIPGGCSSPAKGRAGEYATNGAAAGPVVAASKGTPREEESGEETEMSLSGGLSTSRTRARLASRAELDTSLRSRRACSQAPTRCAMFVQITSLKAHGRADR